MSEATNLARDTLRLIEHGLRTGAMTSLRVEKLLSDGPRKVQMIEMVMDAIKALDAEAANCRSPVTPTIQPASTAEK
jgi:hypothetical protein